MYFPFKIIAFICMIHAAISCISFRTISCSIHVKDPIQRRHTMTSIEHHSSLSISHIADPENICFGHPDDTNKLERFTEYALEMNSTQSVCEIVLIFLDESNTLINALDIAHVETVWKSLNTDVLISTEMACWIGDRPCNDNELRRYETINMYHVASPFAGSAFMGTVIALAEILSLYNEYNFHSTSNFNLFDDNAFTTFMVTTHNNAILQQWTIKLDMHQVIFGSTVYSQHHISSCPANKTFNRISCYDVIVKHYVAADCCSNEQISQDTYANMFEIVESGPRICNMIRLPTLNQFFSRTFQHLALHPLIWHGNGPGNTVFEYFYTSILECEKHNEDQLKYSSQKYSYALQYLANEGIQLGLLDMLIPNTTNVKPKSLHYGNVQELPLFSNTSVTSILPFSNYSQYNLKGGVPRASFNIQNRFRYGNEYIERLLDVFFDNDPWTNSNDYNVTYIHFVSDRTDIKSDERDVRRILPFDAICRFQSPLKDMYTKMIFVKEVAKCAVPNAITSVLNVNMPIIFDLIHKNTNEIILQDITMYQPPLRRYYNYTVTSMIDSIKNPMLKEWLAYNIMIGIEHFYLIYNGNPDVSLDGSFLQYYIQQDIVTFIPFPFAESGPYLWNGIQLVAFQIALQKYGPYSKWMGFYDYDEFLVPTQSITLYNELVLGEFIPALLHKLASSPKFTSSKQCVSMNTIESGPTDLLIDTPSYLLKWIVRGKYYANNNDREGHGKNFYFTERAHSVPQIHRCENPAYFGAQDGAMLLHFDNFRYNDTIPKILDKSIQSLIEELVKDFLAFAEGDVLVKT